MGNQKFQDDIQLVLQAQKVIVHETVRVNVSISAQVDPDQGENEFRGQIHSTLRKFIDGEWKIQSIQRSKGNGKYETVWVQATVRAPERENYQLTDRANIVSRIGFELVNPSVDYSLAFDEIQEINRELRLALIQQALDECKSINEACGKFGYSRRHGGEYRISSTRFDNGNTQQATSNITRATAYASSASPGPMGGSGSTIPMQIQMYNEAADASPQPDEPADVNVSTRFSMIGYFTLRSVVIQS